MSPGKKYLIGICILGIFEFTNAQVKNTSKPNPLDEIYTPPANAIFNQKKGVLEQDRDIFYCLRGLPFEYLRGNIVFENDFNVNKGSVITLGVGYNVAGDQLLKRTLSYAISSWLF